MLIHNIHICSAVWLDCDIYVIHPHSYCSRRAAYSLHVLHRTMMVNCLAYKFLIRTVHFLFCGFLHQVSIGFEFVASSLHVTAFISRFAFTNCCEVVSYAAISTLFVVSWTIFSCCVESSTSTVVTGLRLVSVSLLQSQLLFGCRSLSELLSPIMIAVMALDLCYRFVTVRWLHVSYLERNILHL